MPYDDLKTEFGRTPVYIVEFYFDRCKNTYGVAPCTASGPANLKCFNTLTTCQDLVNYLQDAPGPTDDPGTFGKKRIVCTSARISNFQEAGDPPPFPTITVVETAPTKLEPGRGLGIRSSVEVEIQDHPWTDVGIDPYLSERTVDFDTQGSLWGRIIARNEFYEGRTMILRQGYLVSGDVVAVLRDSNGDPILDSNGEEILVNVNVPDDTYLPENFSSRRFIINKISGPDTRGIVRIEGKDPLKLADIDRAQWPVLSQSSLTADVGTGVSSFVIDDPRSDVADAFAANQRYIRVDDEVMLMTAYTPGAGTLATVNVTRATLPSFYINQPTEDDHNEGATVQVCWLFDNERLDDTVYFLLNTAANIDDFFLPLVDWAAVIDGGFQNYLVSRLLVEPTGVQKLLQELTELNLLLWWDERLQEVRLDMVVPIGSSLDLLTDEDIIAGSVSNTRAVKNRLSQVYLYFGQRSPLETEQKASNYQRGEGEADLDAESTDAFGDSRVKIIFSNWLSAQSVSVARQIAGRLQRAYKKTQVVLQISLDPKDDDKWTGDLVAAQTYNVQDTFGLAALKNYRVTEVEEKLGLGGVRYDYILEEVLSLVRAGVITPDEDPDSAPDPFPDYTAASDELKARYAFIGYDDGTGPPPEPLPFPDGTSPYEVL